MGPDMAGGGQVDMATPKLNCLNLGNCIIQCIIAQQGDLTSCAQSICMKQAKVGSYAKWVNAFQCGQNYCAPTTDMAGKCVRVNDPAGTGNVSLCDPGQTYADCTAQGAPATTCSRCLANARNLILADFSTDPPGPPTGECPDGATYVDCKGGTTCTSLMNSCIMDI